MKLTLVRVTAGPLKGKEGYTQWTQKGAYQVAFEPYPANSMTGYQRHPWIRFEYLEAI